MPAWPKLRTPLGLTPHRAVAIAVTLLLAGLAMALANEGQVRAQKLREATVQAEILAGSVAGALAFDDRETAAEYIRAQHADRDVESVGVYDTQGRLVAGSAAAGARPPAFDSVGPPVFDGAHLTVTVPVLQGTSRLGSVYLRTVVEPLPRRAARYAAVGVLILMASLVIAMFGISNASLAEAHRKLQVEMIERAKAEEALRLSQKAEAEAQLAAANITLTREMSERRLAEDTALAQVQRLNLLHEITRAIGDRQDLDSIFQIVVGRVERQLPVDFACLCDLDELDPALIVRAVGAASQPLALQLDLAKGERIAVDENGLAPDMEDRLVYEPDIAEAKFPLAQRLAHGDLKSLVVASLQVESKVFGVLVVARSRPDAFVSGEREFLRQLSEHVALAAHQAHLHGALQAAYDDLRQSQQAVLQQERLRALGQMASGIAHDINNALSPVALYTESMLETGTGLNETNRRQLEIIRRAVEDVSQTIARMREFYRPREPQLSTLPVQLNELVGHVVDLTKARWSDMAMQRGVVIEVKTELQQDLPLVMGVESEIREALINLVFNAIDAMPEGGVLSLCTASSTTPAPGLVRVEVADTGVGMDEETRRRCLEPFFTTKGERGTGLGLAMVYGVAQRHGAELDLRSVPGAGTTAVLGFAAAAPADNDVQGSGEGPLRKLRLLLVDDDPVLLKALSEALENDGHRVTAANDGGLGIDAFGAGQDGARFDAVITDLGMPYIDGRRVAAAIKGMSQETPVILLTGWGGGMLSGTALPPHIDLVLGKPPKLREIRSGLGRLLADAKP